MACGYKDQNTTIGLILGTGTNACYMEQLDKVGTWDGDYNDPKQVIINTEWGAFGDNGKLNHIRTKYDEEVDLSSANPGKQLFEKMISGMYMGEIVRLIILDLLQKELLFFGHRDTYNDYKTPLYSRGGFYTKFVSTVETDEGIGFSNTRRVLEDIGIRNPTFDDCAIVQHICRHVSKRAARLAGAGLAVLINRSKRQNVTVGVDGSLYRFHPRFKRNMEKCMQSLVHNNIRFHMKLSEDGSGIGAAMVASVSSKGNRLKSSIILENGYIHDNHNDNDEVCTPMSNNNNHSYVSGKGNRLKSSSFILENGLKHDNDNDEVCTPMLNNIHQKN